MAAYSGKNTIKDGKYVSVPAKKKWAPEKVDEPKSDADDATPDDANAEGADGTDDANGAVETDETNEAGEASTGGDADGSEDAAKEAATPRMSMKQRMSVFNGQNTIKHGRHVPMKKSPPKKPPKVTVVEPEAPVELEVAPEEANEQEANEEEEKAGIKQRMSLFSGGNVVDNGVHVRHPGAAPIKAPPTAAKKDRRSTKSVSFTLQLQQLMCLFPAICSRFQACG
jgi:hypothetical protein